MKLVSGTQMKKIDKKTIKDIGIPGIVLMENAAIKAVQQIEQSFKSINNIKVVVICGKGNNGGDGFAISRHLYNKGADVTVINLYDKSIIKGDALTNLTIIENMGIKIMYADETEKLQKIKQIINSFDLIIDAIFGTGIKGQVTGIAKDIIQFVNEALGYVVSIDIPSGIDADTGQICGICVKANETITFGLPKVGTVLYPGKDYTGKLSIVDISIPKSIINNEDIKLNIIDRKQIIDLIPERKNNSHKGDYGKVLIVAGSIGMTGAAVLASEAAIKSGAGLVTTACPAIINDILEVKMTEIMTYPLSDNGTGMLQEECVEQIIDKMNKSDVMVFGPGLSLNGDILKVLDIIISKSDIPLILDADGINALSMNINILNKLKCSMVITPHPGEMSRLTGLTISELEKKRIEVASAFSKRWNVIVLLKGSATVIACPEGDVYINTTGNPGMATAGSGDVLAGIIASLIGQGLNEKNAAILSVFIHGLAGDKAQKTKGMHGLVASDIINEIPLILDELYRGKTNGKFFR